MPLIVELFHPKSVIDLGCGTGTWLAEFREHGIADILGVDGDYISREMLQIPQERFLPFDLRLPCRLDRRFDLAVCLEVAEHIPPDFSEVLVKSLVGLSTVVVFSAAIPFQQGTNHLNEQWPDYWTGRFGNSGYVAIDCIRQRIWQNEAVEWWYAQNVLCFVARNHLTCYPLLDAERARPVLPLVHPRNYESKISVLSRAATAADPQNMSVRQVLSHLPIAIGNALRRIRNHHRLKSVPLTSSNRERRANGKAF